MVRSIQEQNRKLYGEAQAGAAQAAQGMRVWETSITGLSRAFTALGVSALAFKAINFVDQFTAFAEQLQAVSKLTGITVENLHGLQRVAQENEVSFEDLTTGLIFFERALAKTADANSTEAKLLKELGVTSKDVMTATFQLGDAFKNNLDESNRLAAARILLGRSRRE
jgi:hypothetical protein